MSIAENVARIKAQMEKAAIAAGIASLLNISNTDCEEITAFYLAGGFGSRVDAKHAAAIGLFPAELASKIRVLGNAALAGAAQLLLDRNSVTKLRKIAACSSYVSLSGNRIFNEYYMENMLFPVL